VWWEWILLFFNRCTTFTILICCINLLFSSRSLYYICVQSIYFTTIHICRTLWYHCSTAVKLEEFSPEKNSRMRQNVHSAPPVSTRTRPAKHKYNWDRRGSTVGSALGSSPRYGESRTLKQQNDTQFVGFSQDKSSFISYYYKSPSSSSIDSTASMSSSSVGDGLMVKKPYRMMSAINFDDHQKVTSSKRAKKSSVTPANSYERLFGGQVVRSTRPAQLTLFNNQSQQKQFPSKQKINSSTLPVSPITGHVIGNQNLTFVQSPSKSVRSPAGACHSPLWWKHFKSKILKWIYHLHQAQDSTFQ